MNNILLFIFLSNLLPLIKCFDFSYNLEYSYSKYKNSYSYDQIYSDFFLSNAGSREKNSNYFNSLTTKSGNFNSNYFINSKNIGSNIFYINSLSSKINSYNNYLTNIL